MRLSWVSALLALAASSAFAQPLVRISNGITLNGVPQPYLFTWLSDLQVTGSGWRPGETVSIFLNGPLDSPGVAPFNIPLGALAAGAGGNISGTVTIPYDSGMVGPSARIPRPGLYQEMASGAVSGALVSGDYANLAPATYTGPGGAPFDWGHERGGRDGVLPGPFHSLSPERADPEWATVWDERPVEVYGTVAVTGAAGDSQPSLISPSDNPITHDAHDSTIYVVPDILYQWVIGTSNYYAGEPDSAALGRIELEWETRNGGGTDAYGTGNIGLPLWALPTAGDRVYALGRWILDEGHPELGARTEIHPPRLLAVMRQRPAATSAGASAAQVDIYASGHGGGANTMPRGLSQTLNQDGYGGGRIQDALSPNDQQIYYRPGPLPSLLVALADTLVAAIAGQGFTGQVYPSAGPSAFSWGARPGEEMPINDMDYDFDVPLAPAPAGAARPVLEVVTQPQHTTTVNEVVTFTDPDPATGLPTTAHVHLPYRGADSGIYARTLKFSWDAAPPPAAHYRVHLNSVTPHDLPGKWRLWADVNGQWLDLAALAPGFAATLPGSVVPIPDTPIDVYPRAQDTLRVFVSGYRAQCLDGYFGTYFTSTSYEAGLTLLAQCGPSDNDDLGGAVIELDPHATAGAWQLSATDGAGHSHFDVQVTVEAVP